MLKIPNVTDPASPLNTLANAQSEIARALAEITKIIKETNGDDPRVDVAFSAIANVYLCLGNFHAGHFDY